MTFWARRRRKFLTLLREFFQKKHVPECNPTAAECSFGPTCAPLTLSRLRRHVCAPLAAFGGVAPNAPLAPPPAAICSYAPLVFLQPPSAAFFKPRIFKTQCFSNPPPPAAPAPMLLCSFELHPNIPIKNNNAVHKLYVTLHDCAIMTL